MPKYSAGVICICPETKTLLILQSKFHQRWSYPKGYREKNENAKITALRELTEETGIILLENQLLKDEFNCEVPLPKPTKKVPDGIKRITFFVTYIHSKTFIKLSREHKRYAWVNIFDDRANKLLCKELIDVGKDVLKNLDIQDSTKQVI